MEGTRRYNTNKALATLGALVFTSVVWALPGLGAGDPPNLDLTISSDRTFALYRPAGWEVSTQGVPNGQQVTVAAPKGPDFVQMIFLKATDTPSNSVKFASLTLKNSRPWKPGMKVSWARSTRDRRRTVVEFEYEQPDKKRIRGRQYFIMDYPEVSVFGYETEVARFDTMQPVLLSVLSNFTYLDPRQWKGTEKRSNTPAPVNLQMTTRSLPDSSASLVVPSGWGLLGAKGTALCKSSDAAAGFTFSSTEFHDPSKMPNLDGATIPAGLHYPYMAPVDAMMTVMMKFGSSRLQVVERSLDPARAAGVAGFLKRGADVETAVLTFSNENGVRCKGYYDVLGLHPLPSGQWMIIFYAIWAPEAQFDGYVPPLVKMSESLKSNDKWALDYIRQGVANLKRLMAKTSRATPDTASAAGESSAWVFQERRRSEDYLDHKRTSMIRGEQEWLSRVEGGVLHKSDHWGLSREGKKFIVDLPYNYYYYDGRNPTYNEAMTPVDTSREVYESFHGNGP